MNIIKSYIVTNAASSSGGGSGSVLSFSSGDLSPLFTTSVATPTTTPALSFTAVNQNPNLVYAGPATGPAAAPTFRGLVAADIPDLSGVYLPLVGGAMGLNQAFTIDGNFDFSFGLNTPLSIFGGIAGGIGLESLTAFQIISGTELSIVADTASVSCATLINIETGSGITANSIDLSVTGIQIGLSSGQTFGEAADYSADYGALSYITKGYADTRYLSGIVGPANGGTGVANNAASTLTISGNFATTLTVTGTTGVTLPTTGTLATLAGTETFDNKTMGIGGFSVFNPAGTFKFNIVGGALSGNRTVTLAAVNGNALFAFTSAVGTSTRIPFFNTGQSLDQSANLTFVTNRLIGTTLYLTLSAGTATAGTCPLVMTSGTNLTVAISGGIEYNNTFHMTNSDATRRHVVLAPNTTKVTAGAPYANDGYLVMNVGGTDFKIMTTA